MHSGFADLRKEWGMNLRRKKTPKALAGPARDQARRIEDYWRRMRLSHGRGGPFLFGHFTAADAMYAPVVTRFDTYGGDLSPDTRSYCEAVLATDAMKEWYAEAALEPWPEPSPDE
jgi:glutathione S-transferase